MSKAIRITLIALLGVVLEVINYLLVVNYVNYFKIGFSLAGAFIIFVSVFGNIGLQYYLDMKELEVKELENE